MGCSISIYPQIRLLHGINSKAAISMSFNLHCQVIFIIPYCRPIGGHSPTLYIPMMIILIFSVVVPCSFVTAISYSPASANPVLVTSRVALLGNNSDCIRLSGTTSTPSFVHLTPGGGDPVRPSEISAGSPRLTMMSLTPSVTSIPGGAVREKIEGGHRYDSRYCPCLLWKCNVFNA